MKNISRGLNFLEWYTKSLPEGNDEEMHVKNNLNKITEVLKLEQTKVSYLEKINNMKLDTENKYKLHNNIIDLFEQLKMNIFEGKEDTKEQITKKLTLVSIVLAAEAI